VSLPKLPGVYDFDANGTDDLVWQALFESPTGFGVVDSSFDSWQMPAAGGSPTVTLQGYWYTGLLSFGDFNGDGTTDTISFLGTGPGIQEANFTYMSDGTEAGHVLFPGIPTSYFVADSMGDYNGDGKTDVLWRGTADGQVTLWQMNNTQVGAVADLGHVPTSYSIVSATSDFTGNGNSDILWHGNDDGQTTLWVMNGTQVANQIDLGHIPTYLQIVDASGDFNGDGTKDILWRNTNDGTVVEWQMHGGYPTVSVLGQVPTYLQIVDAHGDYNGDGTSDVLWRNTITGEVVDWQMSNGQVAAVKSFGIVPLSYTIVDATSDTNGDGKSDITWESQSGDVVTWQMSSGGPIVVSNGSANQVPFANGLSIQIASQDGSGTGSIIQPDHAGSSYFGSDGPDTFVFTAASNATTVSGNGGSNDYYFSFSPGAAVPTIADFHSGVDQLSFDSNLFGTLAGEYTGFRSGSAPALYSGPDADKSNGPTAPPTGTNVVYDGHPLFYATDTGNLYYEEGSGATPWTSVLLAHLNGAPHLGIYDIA
jgi:hypothetical protein